MSVGWVSEDAAYPSMFSKRVRIFDEYLRWRRPWWARAIAWGFVGYYAVKR